MSEGNEVLKWAVQRADLGAMDFMDFLQNVSIAAALLIILGTVFTVGAWVTFFQMAADIRRTRLEVGAIRELLKADYDERHMHSPQ